MTPTQYSYLTGQLAELKQLAADSNAKLDAALLQQARHDEQIKVLQKSSSGAIALVLGLIAAWLKTTLHL